MYGSVGGCWAALIHRQLQVSPPYTIQFYARSGGESLSGCHLQRASMALNTGPSWATPVHTLGWFDANGAFVDANGVSAGPGFTFPPFAWVKIRIYYALPQANTVRISYWLNDQFYETIKQSPTANESQLAWLTLGSQEGTAWFDDVSVTPGKP